MIPVARHGPVIAFAVGMLIHSAMASDSDWLIHSWQSDDGLPNNNVTSLAQSSDGYLWIANPSRLARFDGVNFANVPSRDIVPESRQKFTAVLRAPSGGMWLGMDRGTVVYLDGKSARIFTNNLPGEYVTSLVEGADDDVWVTFSSDAVCQIPNGKVVQYTTTNGLRPGYACSLARDRQGNLWFAKGMQVGVFRDGHFLVLAELKQSINGIAAASRGGAWLNSGNHLYRVDEAGRVDDLGEFNPQKGPPQPSPLLEDNDHSVWIGTFDNGLYHYDGSGFEKIPMSHRQISCLFRDDENNLWAGTGGGGLTRISRRAVELEGPEQGLPFEAVQSLCQDSNGVIWATTQNGFVACRSNETWNVVITNRSRGGMAS